MTGKIPFGLFIGFNIAVYMHMIQDKQPQSVFVYYQPTQTIKCASLNELD